MKAIVNADDLGISCTVNDAVFQLMADGKVTSATLMANAPNIEEAVRELPRFPHCSFGVHLTLNDLEPLTGHERLAPIVDDDGRFISSLQSVRFTPALCDAVFLEFCAQIQRLRSMGVSISHLDSHKHVHTIRTLFPVLKRVQSRYGIRKVRLARNLYPPGDPAGSTVMMAKKWLFNTTLKRIYRTRTTSGFCDLASFYRRSQTGRMRHSTVEIMVHPGAGQQRFRAESELLSEPWQQGIPFPLEFINYHTL